MGTEDTVTDADRTHAEESEAISVNKWCCISRVLSFQEDFVNEKPLLQHYLDVTEQSRNAYYTGMTNVSK